MATPPPIPIPFALHEQLKKPPTLAENTARCLTLNQAINLLAKGAIVIIHNYDDRGWSSEPPLCVENAFVKEGRLLIKSGRGGVYESTVVIDNIGKTIILDIKPSYIEDEVG